MLAKLGHWRQPVQSSAPKLSQTIDKNAIFAEYTESCHQKETLSEVTRIKKGEPITKPTYYPTIPQLVHGCLMKPSLNHQYMVLDVVLDNVIVKLLKPSESFLTDEDVANLSEVNCLYQEMIHDVVRLRTLDFSQLQEPRIGYAKQTAIQPSCVDMAVACLTRCKTFTQKINCSYNSYTCILRNN